MEEHGFIPASLYVQSILHLSTLGRAMPPSLAGGQEEGFQREA